MEKTKKNFAIQALRRASYRWKARNEAMNLARVERGIYKCNICQEKKGRKDITLDHINPVVDPDTGWTDFDNWIERLLVEVDGWQAICKPCHKIKSNLENEIRRKNKKKQKTKKRKQ